MKATGNNNLNKIVPGDLLIVKYFPLSWHIAMVQKIDYSNNRITISTDIRLIESTWNEPNRLWAKVVSTINGLNNYTWVQNWWIVRLRTN